jgi:hypothetical protein
MPKRPKPDLEHTREALRRHDERVGSEEPEDTEGAEPDEGDEEESEDRG